MRVVAIGGGHGAAATLKSALLFADEVAGVITVADDGGSSGRLATELGVTPMGDIRNCLAALAPDSPAVAAFQHRFGSGKLEGHVVGNLMMAAAEAETGSFIEAIRQAAKMLNCRGKIVPPTLAKVSLTSEIDGELIRGQVAVATSSGRISYVALDPSAPPAYPEAVHLLENAELVVLGPGSLFTSVLPSLLVPGIKDAYNHASALKVYVCNLTAPVGETGDFDACSHLAALYAHLGEASVDVVVAHEGRTPRSDSPVVRVDRYGLEGMGTKVMVADLLPDDLSPRHDPARLASCLSSL